jgi:predicted nuclease with TOPRIM domain
MELMEQAASSSLDKIAEAEAEISYLKRTEDEQSVKLKNALKEVEEMKTKIANHKSVATEVGDVLKDRETRIKTLEELCKSTANDVQRLSKQQLQDKVFIDHLERLIKARNLDLANEKSKLDSATLTATNALKQMKKRYIYTPSLYLFFAVGCFLCRPPPPPPPLRKLWFKCMLIYK